MLAAEPDDASCGTATRMPAAMDSRGTQLTMPAVIEGYTAIYSLYIQYIVEMFIEAKSSIMIVWKMDGLFFASHRK